MKSIPYLLFFFPMLCFAQLKIELKNIEHNKCDGDEDGHLAVEVTGGSGMYQYSWLSFADAISDMPESAQLHSGEYCLTVTDLKNTSQKAYAKYEILTKRTLDYHYHIKCSTGGYGYGNGLIINEEFEGLFDSIVGLNYPFYAHHQNNIGGGLFINYDTILIKNQSELQTQKLQIYFDSSLPVSNRIKKLIQFDDGQNCPVLLKTKLPDTMVPLEILKMTPDTVYLDKGEEAKIHLELKFNLPLDSIVKMQWSVIDNFGKKYKDNLPKSNIFDFTAKYAHTYKMVATSTHGCELEKEFYVERKEHDTKDTIVTVPVKNTTFLPTAFSPNDDGYNDQLTLYGAEGVEKVVWMRVFDPWGNLIFEQKDFPAGDNHYGWDGTYKGIAANIGVYACTYRILLKDGTERTLNNSVSLMR